MRSESVSAGAEKREIRIKRLTADGRGDNMMSNLKPLKGRKRVTDSERVGGGVMSAETEPDNMGPRGPRRKETSSRGRNARVRSLTVMAVDEWVRQRCRVNAGWHRRIRILSRQQVLLSGFLFVGKTKLETTCPCRFREMSRKRGKTRCVFGRNSRAGKKGYEPARGNKRRR